MINERVSLSVSLNIPYRTNQRLSIAKLRVEQEVEQLKIDLKREEEVRALNRVKRKMELKIEEYKKIKEITMIAKAERLILINNLTAQTIINPKIIIENKVNALVGERSLLSLEEAIVDNYLDYLSQVGAYDNLELSRAAVKGF